MNTATFCDEHEDNMSHLYNRWLAIMAYSCLAVVAIAMAVVMFWLFYPYHVVTSRPDVFPLVNNQRVVVRGETFAYEFWFDKKAVYPATVNKAFVDGLRFQAEGKNINLPAGKGHAVVEVEVPRTLPPGSYHLEITRIYHVNPLRDVILTNRTEKFLVIAPQR